MRAALVFPPHVSPTYVPLGIAALVAFVAERAPECRVTAVDANLALWERVCSASDAGGGLRRFLLGL
ncbi:MAG TPA: hypothetical protein VK997_03855, partial [Deferrisomatales bacterium]|nr:hypothetical protein [Deferrisomatales bacterium]